jgi:hypothetical protein
MAGVTLNLTNDEAVVLFELLAHYDRTGELKLRHNAEFVVLNNVLASLEKSLVEPFRPEYEQLISAARERVAEGYDGPLR